MKPRSFYALATVLMLVSPAPGQAPGSSGQNLVPQADQDVTLRISVNLVQVDAVVTDAKGKHVGDLKPEDFEVTQDGKPQKITHFSYVVTTPQPPQPKPQPAVRSANTRVPPPPPPPMRLTANQVRRTMAFVVDDLGLSFESIAYIRSALKKFVDQQMQPGDFVAIVRTGAGMGALQQFTAEKRLLYAAIDKVKWNPMGRVGISSFAPMGSDEGGAGETEFRERVFSVGTLGAVSFIVNGLKELPGRKSVVLFSEHMRMFNRDGSSDEVKDSMLRLTDQANRASVVIYTIDPRGLPTLSFTAADRVENPTRPDQMAEQMSRRSQEHWESQEGLSYLSDQTGGIFAYNTNDISGSINKVLEDQSGYYLIGWNPGAGVFDAKRSSELYHKIRIRVKPVGLHVRTRNGFYGTPDSAPKPAYSTRDEQLFAALQSPFGSADVGLRLTALFANNQKMGSYVYSLLHIKAKDLTFVEDVVPNDKGKNETWQMAKIDVLMITFGDSGQELDRSNTTYTVRVKGQTYKHVLQAGFIYTMNHTIKKAGAYQLRAAVRDANSGKAGSASQFIEVPDIGKGKLALSGIVLKERDPNMALPAPAPGNGGSATTAPAPQGKPAAPAQAKAAQPNNDDIEGGPALRVFQPGKMLTYGVQVINAKPDGPGKQPDVETQLRIFRDGKEMYAGKPIPIQAAEQKDPKRLVTGGFLRLGTAMEPGDYVLQLVATDKAKNATATQWIDFEVAEKKKPESKTK